MTKASTSAEITITGLATNEGVECPAVRGDDGKLYTVVGKGVEKLKAGVRVKITGVIVEVSTCMQGTTIRASSVEVAGSSS